MLKLLKIGDLIDDIENKLFDGRIVDVWIDEYDNWQYRIVWNTDINRPSGRSKKITKIVPYYLIDSVD